VAAKPEETKTPTKTTRARKAPAPVEADLADSVVALDTLRGDQLVIRGNPTDAAVRKFVKEQRVPAVRRLSLFSMPSGTSTNRPYSLVESLSQRSTSPICSTPLKETRIRDVRSRHGWDYVQQGRAVAD
jgi:hypothetical protein